MWESCSTIEKLVYEADLLVEQAAYVQEYFIFFIAGSETTGHTIAWTLCVLTAPLVLIPRVTLLGIAHIHAKTAPMLTCLGSLSCNLQGRRCSSWAVY